MASTVRDDSVKPAKKKGKRKPKSCETWMKEIAAALHSLAASVELEDKMVKEEFCKTSKFLKSRLDIALYRMSLVADANSDSPISYGGSTGGFFANKPPGYRALETKEVVSLEIPGTPTELPPHLADDGEGNIVRVAGGPRRRSAAPKPANPETVLLDDADFISES